MVAPQFEIVDGPAKGKIFALKEGTGHLLGRHQDAAYSVDDPRISRHHCELSWVDGAAAIVDRGGSGGTHVNGEKIAAITALKHGDSVTVGDTTLKFYARSSGETDTLRGVQPGSNASADPKAIDKLAELAGRELSHFAIEKAIGKGSSSMVFQATDTENDRVVALKVMEPTFAANDDEIQRFVRAMKTMLPLKHPNLVQVYAAGKSGPYCWSSMELIEGEGLTDVIGRIGVVGMLDWKYSFKVAVQIGRGLAYAHRHGIIHRDVSPANILIRNSDKSALLGDLMLAKALDGTLAKQITRPGEVVGDINYMSPERTRGVAEGVDGRSDLFSLGATAYALLTGKPPFAGASMIETIAKLRAAEPEKPSKFQIGIPTTFEGVVLKLLAKNPDDRYQTAEDAVAELERIGKFNGVLGV